MIQQIKRVDPRYYILAFLTSFVVAGQVYLGFFQQWDAFFAAVATAVVVELLLAKLTRHKWIFPLSALITGIGISLLLSSHLVWPYALTSFLAISLKYAIRYRNRHIFNPNNLAMVLMLFFLPQYAVSTPKQWTNGVEIMVLILVLGFLAAYVADRLDTVLAFITGFAVFAVARHYLFDEPWFYSFGSMLGASFQLFTFFMITDPQTTPPDRRARIVFAVLIALADAILRVNSITNSQFYASFLVILLVGIPYKYWMNRRARKDKDTGNDDDDDDGSAYSYYKEYFSYFHKFPRI